MSWVRSPAAPQSYGKVLLGLTGAVMLLAGIWIAFDYQGSQKNSNSGYNTNSNSELVIDGATPNQNMPKEDVTQLKIDDLKIGTGVEVKTGDTVVIHYLGTLMDGTKFDSSYDRGQPFETQIGVGMVIKGWDLGVPGMKVGGKRKLIIPSELAYGSRAVGGVIPANSDLIFEVELIGIK